VGRHSAAGSARDVRRTGLRAVGTNRGAILVFVVSAPTVRYTIESVAGVGGAMHAVRSVQK